MALKFFLKGFFVVLRWCLDLDFENNIGNLYYNLLYYHGPWYANST